jgi:DNA-binding response OmpR family regulator
MSAAALRASPNARILVVEDDPDVCELIGDMLEEGGYAVHCLETGEDAYAALDSGRAYLALVVDLNLGAGVTGFDVARHAREANPDVPVLYVSGETPSARFGLHAVPGGVRLAKPIERMELLSRLEALLSAPSRA